MKVHEIIVRDDGDGFVVSAEKRMPLEGARVWVSGEEVSGDWYRPTKIEIHMTTSEGVVATIGRLLRDGIQ